MEQLLALAPRYLAFMAVALPISFLPHETARRFGMSMASVAFCYWIFFHGDPGGLRIFASYAGGVALAFAILRVTRAEDGLRYLAPLIAPVAVLAYFKTASALQLIGISYLTFRLAYVAYEVNAGKIELPSFADYVGFAFFPLTFLSGPISPLQFYSGSLSARNRPAPDWVPYIARILVGVIKLVVLANLALQLSIEPLLKDGYYHSWLDAAAAAFFSLLYLYLNFAGATDIFVGAGAILGIRVKENFDNPLLATSLQAFWQRWHISLTEWVRDVVFNPTFIALHRTFRGRILERLAPLIMPIALTLNFLLISLWHNVSLNFALLGLFLALGMTINYWWNLAAKAAPPRLQRALAPLKPISPAIGWLGTMAWMSAAMFFTNFTYEEMTRTVLPVVIQ